MKLGIRVMLVDDHDLVREGLKLLLSAEPTINVVAEAANAEYALNNLEEANPDVILMDITLPNMDGIALTAVIKERHPNIQVTMLTMHVDEQFVARSIQAGASAYIVKSATREELVDTIRMVYKGQELLPMKQIKQLIGDRAEWIDAKNEYLSPRERQVLQLVSNGLANKEIGTKLFISISTVKSHLHRIYTKLNVKDRAETISKVIKEGIL